MTTEPVTPSTSPVSVITKVEKDIAWVKGHVISVLLAVALIAGSIIGGIYLFEGLIERHDARVAAQQLQKEGIDTQTQAALVAQLQQERAADATRDATELATINSLVAQMKQSQAQTAKQVSTDATLNAQDAANRLVAQTKMSSSDVTVAGNTVTMDLPLTRIVIANLDELPQAQSDVTNLQGQLSAQQILTTDAKTELATANSTIAADKTELIQTIQADNAACKVRVDAQATKDRKRGFWATIGGSLGGVVLGSRL